MELVVLIVTAVCVGLFVVITGASITGSLGTIADELRRLNDRMDRGAE